MSSSLHSKLAILQVLDLITQFGGALEFVSGGGGAHFMFKPHERLFDFNSLAAKLSQQPLMFSGLVNLPSRLIQKRLVSKINMESLIMGT